MWIFIFQGLLFSNNMKRDQLSGTVIAKLQRFVFFCPPTKTCVSNSFYKVFKNCKRSCFSAQPRNRCISNDFIRFLHNCVRSCSSAQAGTLDSRRSSCIVLVFQRFCNGSQGKSMAWTGEEGRRVFLPTAQNVVFPMVLQGFPLTVCGRVFCPG